MNAKPLHYARPIWAAIVAALFLAILVAAPRAEANSGAGGTILNTVTVTYKDAGGTSANYQASATSSVTINLVKAALTYSGMPTGAKPGTTASLPAAASKDSGLTATYLIALTANSNGGDTYNLSEITGTIVNMASDSVTWATMQNDGATQITGGSPGTVALGGSVIMANTATTISIPGGSNLVALITANAAAHKVLVVNGVDYIVSGIAGGDHAPSNTNGGNTYYSTLGTPTAEAPVVITLAANPSGSNTTPAFTVNGLVGQLADEQILVKVSVTGVVGTTVGTDGKVPFNLHTTSSGGGNPLDSAVITTTFYASNLQIRKTVRNCGASATYPVGSCGATPYTATAAGNPGDILEYKVDIENLGSSSASVVSAQDAVPVYTTLISFTTATYGDTGTLGTGLGTQYFASVTDGITPGSLTIQSSDTDVANVGAGDAAGITAGSAIHFFLGSGCSNIAGGSIATTKTYTILYRMKIN